MSKIWKSAVSFFAIYLLFTQTIFGSVSVLAESNGSPQPILNTIMTSDGQPIRRVTSLQVLLRFKSQRPQPIVQYTARAIQGQR